MLFATPDSIQYRLFLHWTSFKTIKIICGHFLDVPSKYLSWECIFHDRARVKICPRDLQNRFLQSIKNFQDKCLLGMVAPQRWGYYIQINQMDRGHKIRLCF